MDVANCVICGRDHRGRWLPAIAGEPDRFVCLICVEEIAHRFRDHHGRETWSPPRPVQAATATDETSY